MSDNPFGNVQYTRKPAGYLMIDGQDMGNTIQCVHCGKHWVPVIGSGKIRGWCPRCQGMICGANQCILCIPMERKLELAEGKKPKKIKELEYIAEHPTIL